MASLMSVPHPEIFKVYDNTVDIGMVPTPFTYFASHELGIGSACHIDAVPAGPDMPFQREQIALASSV